MRAVRGWPSGAILQVVQPIAAAAAAAVHHAAKGRRWSWPESLSLDCAQAIAWRRFESKPEPAATP